MANREEAQKRMDAVARYLGLSRDQRQGLHRHLAKNYWESKDRMSFWDLLRVAREFLRQ